MSIDKRPDGRYRARWREFPGGPQKTRHFDRKVDAERFLVHIEHSKLVGAYVDPSAGQVTVATYAEEWTSRRSWAPSTADKVGVDLRRHILPSLGPRPLASLRRSHIEAWAKTLPLAPSTVETTFQTLANLLACAVEDGRLARNPASGARLPKAHTAPLVPLTPVEVKALVAALPDRYRAAGVLAAGTGLRQAELFGLTIDRVDFMGRSLRVDRQLWTPRDGPPVFAPPKTKASYRAIALSPLVTSVLSAHVATFSHGPDGHLFTIDAGRPVNRTMASKTFRRARDSAGLLNITWHDLRHHHASVLLSAGVSPALVAERLGHSIETLLRTYAHVIRSDEDRVRSIVDRSLGGSAEDWLRTEGIAG